jgi:single-strand DNA-binding protein
VDHTEWHNIVVFGKTAENCNAYLKKGRQAFVEGRIQTRKWQDKEGKDRYTTEIIAQTVQFVGGKGADSGYSAESSQGGSLGRSEPEQDISFEDDDIPF